MPTVTAHKVQGYRGQIGYTPSGGGAVTLLAGLKEISAKFTVEELDSTDHGVSSDPNPAKDRMQGLADFEGTAKFDYIEGDTSQNALMAAIFNRTPLAVTIFPEQAAGQNSFVGNVRIFAADLDAKTELQGLSITMKGCRPGFTIVAQS
jgi:hypothetical protein